MSEKNVYTDLADNLGVPNSERFVKVLEASFSTEEAKICRELFNPATCKELAARLKLDEKDVSKTLDKLVDNGSLTRGPTQYAFHTSLLAYHHESVADTAPHAGPNAIPKKVLELWNDFFRNEWSYTFLEHTAQMIKMIGRNLPISPTIEGIERSPDLDKSQIMPEENWKLRIENAKRRIIGPCGCRITWGICNKPMMTCFSGFDRPRGEYYLNKPGRLLKEVTLAEAVDIALEAEDAGLVHWGDCYCCDCCCENLFPVTRGKRFDLMTPNRFLAVVDQDKCSGCQACMERCYFEAIDMVQTVHAKKYKASIDKNRCKGCGLCITKCPKNAITYVIVRPPEYLKPPPPPNSRQPGQPVHVIPVWGHYNLK